MADTFFDLAPLIESALADPNVVQKIVSAIDVSSLVASDEVKEQLLRIVADPAFQQQLLSRLDVTALINPAVSQQLLANLDISAVVTSPGVLQQLLAAVRPVEMIKHRIATDDGVHNHATLALTSGIYVVVLCSMYAILVWEWILTAAAVGLYLLSFVTSSTFQFVWFFLPFHVARAGIASCLVARRLPTFHTLVRRPFFRSMHCTTRRAPREAALCTRRLFSYVFTWLCSVWLLCLLLLLSVHTPVPFRPPHVSHQSIISHARVSLRTAAPPRISTKGGGGKGVGTNKRAIRLHHSPHLHLPPHLHRPPRLHRACALPCRQ